MVVLTAIGVGVAGTAAAIAVPLALADDDDGKGLRGPSNSIFSNFQVNPVDGTPPDIAVSSRLPPCAVISTPQA